MNQRSPQRQSMPRSLVRNEPTTRRARLWIHPSRRSWRMPASTSGKPVRPSHHASKAPSAWLQPIVPAVALLELRPGVAREVEQHVLVEVAPAELPVEGVRALPTRQPLLDLPDRDAAEVQVGRQSRGAVLAHGVVIGGIAPDVVGQETREPLARRLLASGRRLLHLLLEAERLQRRQPALPQAEGSVGSERGAPSTSRRGASCQVRWKGENTV